MYEGLIKLAASAQQGFQRPNLKNMMGSIHNAKDANNTLKSWYKGHSGEQNRTYVNPTTGTKSVGNPWLRGLKSWSAGSKKTPLGENIKRTNFAQKQYDAVGKELENQGD